MGRKKISITPITDERNKQVSILWYTYLCLITLQTEFLETPFLVLHWTHTVFILHVAATTVG